MDKAFKMVKQFHDVFDPSPNQVPKNLNAEEALNRSEFFLEEIVEFLYAASDHEDKKFADLTASLHQSIETAITKVSTKEEQGADSLTDEVDALMDILYLTYGSFVLMGVDPTEIFKLVHEANMHKKFPDGTAHFDPRTHKILKPAGWQEHFAPEKAILAELQRQKKSE